MRRITARGDGSAAYIPRHAHGWATVRLHPKTNAAPVLLRTIPITPVRGRRFPRRAATGAALPLPRQWAGTRAVPSRRGPPISITLSEGVTWWQGRGLLSALRGTGSPGPTEIGRPSCFKKSNGPREATNSAPANPQSARQSSKGSARGPPPSTRSTPADPQGVCRPARGVLGVRPRACSIPFEAPALLQWAPPGGLASDRAFNAKPAKLPGVSADRPTH